MKKIICFGEVLWDILPEGAHPGGAPMNVAIHLKRHGFDSYLISRIGKDKRGEDLKSFLVNAGLSLQFLQEDQELPTSTVLVNITEEGDADYEINEPVAWDNIQFNQELEHLAGDAGIVIYGTLASRNTVTRKTLLYVLEQSEALRILDVNLRPPYDDRLLVEALLFKADFVKLNEDELLVIAGWNHQTGSEVELVEWLARHYNCESVCVTKGANGAYLLYENHGYSHKGFKVDAVDTVGAGDAFLAGLIAGLSKRLLPGKALEYASATGALVASRAGAVPEYTNSDIESFIL